MKINSNESWVTALHRDVLYSSMFSCSSMFTYAIITALKLQPLLVIDIVASYSLEKTTAGFCWG